MKNIELVTDDLAECIRLCEAEVVELKHRVTIVMAGDHADVVVVGLNAREKLMVRGGQLSGLRIAWEVLTGERWELQHPQLRGTDS